MALVNEYPSGAPLLWRRSSPDINKEPRIEGVDAAQEFCQLDRRVSPRP
jgi:hypothetical protein